MRRILPALAILISLLAQPGSSTAAVIISEIMAQNLTSAVLDEDGSNEDWLELFNNGTTTVNLNGWYLTDDAGNKQKWRFPLSAPAVNIPAGGYLVVWCSGKNRKAVATKLHTNFKLDAGGEYLGLIRPDGLTVENEFAPKYPPQFADGVYGITMATTTIAILPEGANGKAKVATSAQDFTDNFTGWNTSLGFNDSSWVAGPSGFGFGTPFEGLTGTDISAMMQGQNASCFARFIFNIPAGTSPIAARLKTKFDDGYIAYLNGTRIASFYAPNPANWNSATLANLPRPDASASTFETPSTYTNQPLPLLVTGDNLLAFHLFNSNAADDNVLLRPQFEIDVVSGTAPGYLVSATPGAANSLSTNAVGPSVSQVTDRPPRPAGGAGSAPLVISAKVTPTLRPLAASGPVVLKYRVMYGSETAITMLDDGAAVGASGDAVAGDGIFTAKVPTTGMAAGQMIRWRIEARDNGAPATYGYAPPYPFSASTPPSNPPTVNKDADLDQYYGTVALDGITTSLLPILHWFAQTPANADGTTGESCSLFFQPMPVDNPPPGYVQPPARFYDNIPMNRHGQSSGGFPQKSHNASFNKENRLRWKDGEPNWQGINLLTTYADKSKIRHVLAYDTWMRSGHVASHIAQTIRVQQNGAFKGLYDLVEDANRGFLERAGLDPELGALYKVYNRLENANVAVNNGNGSEKKNPDDGDFSDLSVFVAGISSNNAMTDRLRYSYDNVDIASLVNLAAVSSLILSRDYGHKNYYVYRDTTGTGEWSMLPWDQDLSFGHTWNGTNNYWDDDMHSQAPVRIGVTDNRLLQILWGTNEFNSMYVARIRTLMNTFLVSGSETNGPLEQRMMELINRIDPNPENPQTGTDDADLNARQWGFWLDGSGTQIPYTDPQMNDHTPRDHVMRLINFNPVPPYPGSNPYANWGDGSTSLLPFLPGRRGFFFANPAPLSGSLPIPATPPANPTLIIEGVDFNPSTGTPTVLPADIADKQGFEYFIIRNPNSYAVDISGWKLSGEINMTFRGGTVLPGVGTTTTQATNTSYVNQLIVANKPRGFRQRTASPKGNEYRYVAGPYKGQLSARGGTIILSRPNDPLNPAAGTTQIATHTYTPAPTQSQQFLRITELNYNPANPTPDELAALPGVSASEFEYIEITNAGAATMNLAGARFERGVEFTFPSTAVSTIAPGERRLIVSNLLAFQTRYGNAHDAIILGEYEGNLANGGEELQLLDPAGEVVLEFTYDDAWYPPTDGKGRTLVTRIPGTSHTEFGKPQAWAISGSPAGTPGAAETTFARVYEGWRWDHFTTAELTAPSTLGNLLEDADGDKMNNYEEYVFGRNPRAADNTGSLATAGKINVAGNDHLTITFDRVANALDVTWNVEAGNSPGNFPDTAIFLNSTDLGDGRERVTYRDPAPLGAGGRHMRVRAVKP